MKRVLSIVFAVTSMLCFTACDLFGPSEENIRKTVEDSIKRQVSAAPNNYALKHVTIEKLKVKKYKNNKYDGKLTVKLNNGKTVDLDVDIKIKSELLSSKFDYSWEISKREVQKLLDVMDEDDEDFDDDSKY